jgi:hypothetical protein
MPVDAIPTPPDIPADQTPAASDDSGDDSMDDGQGGGDDTAYPLPQQYPRTDPPSNVAPHPVATDGWLTDFEKSNPNFNQILEELERLKRSVRNWSAEPVAAYYRPQVISAMTWLIDKLRDEKPSVGSEMIFRIWHLMH